MNNLYARSVFFVSDAERAGAFLPQASSAFPSALGFKRRRESKSVSSVSELILNQIGDHRDPTPAMDGFSSVSTTNRASRFAHTWRH